MPPNEVTPESEARWQAWLGKGRARELRRNHKIQVVLLVVFSGGAVVASLVLALM